MPASKPTRQHARTRHSPAGHQAKQAKTGANGTASSPTPADTDNHGTTLQDNGQPQGTAKANSAGLETRLSLCTYTDTRAEQNMPGHTGPTNTNPPAEIHTHSMARSATGTRRTYNSESNSTEVANYAKRAAIGAHDVSAMARAMVQQ